MSGYRIAEGEEEIVTYDGKLVTKTHKFRAESISKAAFYAHTIVNLLMPGGHFLGPHSARLTVLRSSAPRIPCPEDAFKPAFLKSNLVNTTPEHQAYVRLTYEPKEPIKPAELKQLEKLAEKHETRLQSSNVTKIIERAKNLGIYLNQHPVNIDVTNGRPVFFEIGLRPDEIKEKINSQPNAPKILKLLGRYEEAVRRGRRIKT
ncbi:TPA: hypothetical protein HA318_06305 [Candidatus Micrarchaeota archaeon]|nr:hypothetical protein [Candidatus Micrarchaeota archaeon]